MSLATIDTAPKANLDTPGQSNGCGIENSTFNQGEEIIYKVYYNWNFIWISAGEVRFNVRDSGDMYHVVVLGRTYDSYDRFYRVRDRFETYLDKQTLMPSVFIRHVEEGKYRRYNKFIFDQESKSVDSYQGHSADSNELVQLSFDECMHDVLSILYYMRNLNLDTLNSGDAFPIKVFLEEEYPLNVRVVEKNSTERIKGMGKVPAHVLRSELIAGEVFKDDDQMTAYISTDQNRIPLMLESPLTVGKMKAVLVHHDGLRYPFNYRFK